MCREYHKNIVGRERKIVKKVRMIMCERREWTSCVGGGGDRKGSHVIVDEGLKKGCVVWAGREKKGRKRSIKRRQGEMESGEGKE